MARILCVDYGSKRTGLAVTDPLKIIATALATVPTHTLFDFLQTYFSNEPVELLLVGEPSSLDGSDTHATPLVKGFINRFKKLFPAIPVATIDEQYTSKMAAKAMVEMGMKKKDRRIKGNIDQVAATMLLQEYLNSLR